MNTIATCIVALSALSVAIEARWGCMPGTGPSTGRPCVLATHGPLYSYRFTPRGKRQAPNVLPPVTTELPFEGTTAVFETTTEITPITDVTTEATGPLGTTLLEIVRPITSEPIVDVSTPAMLLTSELTTGMLPETTTILPIALETTTSPMFTETTTPFEMPRREEPPMPVDPMFPETKPAVVVGPEETKPFVEPPKKEETKKEMTKEEEERAIVELEKFRPSQYCSLFCGAVAGCTPVCGTTYQTHSCVVCMGPLLPLCHRCIPEYIGFISKLYVARSMDLNPFDQLSDFTKIH